MKVYQLLEQHEPYKIISVVNVDDSNAIGTSKKGTIHAFYDELVKLFGEPHTYGKDSDTSRQWVLDFYTKNPYALSGNGKEHTIVTIYDRFNFGDPSETTQWEVGGKDRKAIHVLDDFLQKVRH